MLKLIESLPVHALAHITGGGLLENIPRVMPKGTIARFDRSVLRVPPIFRWMQSAGGIEWKEMFRVFNCGTGMIAVVDPSDADKAVKTLADYGLTAYVAGEIADNADPDAAPYVDGLL